MFISKKAIRQVHAIYKQIKNNLSEDRSFTNNGMNGSGIIEKKHIFFKVAAHIEKMKDHVIYYDVFVSVVVRKLLT